MPRRCQRPAIGVIDDLRVRVQVEVIALVNELEIRQRPSTARLDPFVVRLPCRAMGAVVLGPERFPLAVVIRRQSAEGRGDVGTFHLQWLAADDAHVRHTGRGQRGEAVDVVLDDHIGTLAIDDLRQLRLAVHRPIDQCLPRRLYEPGQLIEGRGTKHRLGVADEVGPELSCRLLGGVGGWGWCEVDEVLDEPERLEPAGPRCLGREHHRVALPAQDVADPDAVVRRPVGAFRHEQEGGHGYRSSVTPGASIELAARLLGRKCSVERPITVDQTNYSVVVDDAVVVKWLRPAVPVPHPGVQLIRHLAKAGFDEMPAFVGVDERDGVVYAIVTAYLPAALDGWDWYVDDVERWLADELPLEDVGRAGGSHGSDDCPSPRLAGRHAAVERRGRLRR